jgi:hypothetical protein
MGEELQYQQNGSSVTSNYGYGSSLAYDQSQDIESAANTALLREQEIETQKIIQGQRFCLSLGLFFISICYICLMLVLIILLFLILGQ